MSAPPRRNTRLRGDLEDDEGENEETPPLKRAHLDMDPASSDLVEKEVPPEAVKEELNPAPKAPPVVSLHPQGIDRESAEKILQLDDEELNEFFPICISNTDKIIEKYGEVGEDIDGEELFEKLRHELENHYNGTPVNLFPENVNHTCFQLKRAIVQEKRYKEHAREMSKITKATTSALGAIMWESHVMDSGMPLPGDEDLVDMGAPSCVRIRAQKKRPPFSSSTTGLFVIGAAKRWNEKHPNDPVPKDSHFPDLFAEYLLEAQAARTETWIKPVVVNTGKPCRKKKSDAADAADRRSRLREIAGKMFT